jgi:phosphate:Na+ symporter
MISVLQVLGGLALFLYGVGMLNSGMEKLTGRRIQQWLDRMTNRPLKGAVFGLTATALIQSSGLLMVTMIGLINANLMTLEQAIGVMMGQEIGTTLTAQIVAFKIGDLCFLFIALGFIIIEFVPRPGWRDYGEITLAFGVLFLGMNLMAAGLKVLSEVPWVATWLATMGRNPVAGVMAGALATAAVQSSSATTSLVVAMGISNTITLRGAIALVLGANIGSCITGLIAAVRSSRAARQASVAQILINVVGVVLFLILFTPFVALVSRTSPVLSRQVANAHTIFNVLVSVLFFPFIRLIAKVSRALVPAEEQQNQPKLTAYIDERQYHLPAVAVVEASRELIRIGEVTAQMVERSRQALVDGDKDAAGWVLEQESGFVDPTRRLLEDFVSRLMQGQLNVSQQRRCFQLKSLIVDIERVGDHAENLAQAAQRKMDHDVKLSAHAIQDLDDLYRHAHRTYELALRCVQDENPTLARQVCDLEEEFDHLYTEARQRHIDRSTAGVCQPEADVLFVESLRNLERISDHADNLGVSTIYGSA